MEMTKEMTIDYVNFFVDRTLKSVSFKTIKQTEHQQFNVKEYMRVCRLIYSLLQRRSKYINLRRAFEKKFQREIKLNLINCDR